MSAPGPSTMIRKKRRRRRRAPLFPFVLLGLAIVGIFVGGVWLSRKRPAINTSALPEVYLADLAVLRQEYSQYYGNDENLSNVNGPFRSAADLTAKRNFPEVTSVLEMVARTARVPIVFHDLGLAYAMLGDSTRASDAFREVLARDPVYPSTRKFLRDYKGIPVGGADPYTREQEPNDDRLRANLIALRTPVGGEIADSHDSADSYRFIAPQAPRDLIAIEVTNYSNEFKPRLHVYDDQLRALNWGDTEERSGRGLRIVGAGQANTSLTVSVTSADGKTGAYLLTVTPLRAFDGFEPNDVILAAKKISFGEEISANVMDSADTDFYSLVSPRKGTVSVEIRNRSNTLIPALGVYNSDRRNVALVQHVQKPGANLRHMIDVEKDQTYYLQISSQAGSAGAYSLRVD